MATLTFLTPDGAENQFELSGELSVGREVGNDVVLPEGGLSRKHCRFFDDGGQFYVEDLGSSNGTFVDGERIAEPTAIAAGQEILVANIKVVFDDGAARAGTPKRQASSARRAAASSARTGQIASVPARRSPAGAAPARRGSSAGAPGRRGGGAAPALADDAGPDAAPAASARAVLKGLTGPWAGKRFPLANVVSVVGRTDGNDVVVEDDSVSRRHAEVRKSGPGYAVRDLNSANGTFVNGERITEAPLRPGDVVKFGVVEFSYSGPSLGKLSAVGGGGADAGAKKQKLLIGAGVAVGAILLIGVVKFALAPPPSANPNPDVGAQGPQQQEQEDPAVLLGQCRSFSDTESQQLDWARAVKACDAVLKADPINADARKLKKLSEKELGQKKIFDHAHDLYSLGQEEAAMQEFDRLESDSFYFAQARNEYRKGAEAVKKRNGDACASGDRANQFDKAWVSCKQYEDIACYLGTEDKYQKLFVELQKRFKKDEWSCPKKYERWLKRVGGDGPDARYEALKAKYPDKDLADAMNVFARDPVSGRNRIMKYRDSGKDAAKTNQILQMADTMYSKHQSAYEKILANKLDQAAEDIRREIEADHVIMPDKYESDIVNADREHIADKYAEVGKLLFSEKRYVESYKQCVSGWGFTHANLNVGGCLADLEAYAQTLSGGCDEVSLAMKITRPEALVHKGAEAAGKKMGCN